MPRYTRGRKSKASEEEKRPGAFTSSGSYSATAELYHRGRVDAFVRALVKQRRAGSLSIDQAARAIRAADMLEAFPQVGAWETTEHWAMVPCSTAAEESVKREGHGADGHWCGQRWIQGPERDCEEPRHRQTLSPAEMLAQIAEITASLGVVTQYPPVERGGNRVTAAEEFVPPME